MLSEDYVIGVDFGTGSVRSLLVDAHGGEEIARSEFVFPRWKQGLYCDAAQSQFRQHPLDHIEGLEHTLAQVVSMAGAGIAQRVRAISVDTTGSTPVAVDPTGTPLALKPGFGDNPNAMFFLWKDHTALQEADDINRLAGTFGTDYLKYSGEIYSPEWFWAKLLYVLRRDQAVAEACFSWVEHCDWIPFWLCGGSDANQIKRGICAAGHKALWAEAHGGLPSRDFLLALDPVMDSLDHPLFDRTYPTDQAVGTLSDALAHKLGLPQGVQVGVGALDAHMGAVGGQIEPYFLSKVMGTSTCDMMVVPQDQGVPLIKGLCGQVPGSIVPGMIGLEAGQSAFGDVFAWFETLLTAPLLQAMETLDGAGMDLAQMGERIGKGLLDRLAQEAAGLELLETDEISLDWFNGRRSPHADPYLKASLWNLNLGSDPARIYRALVEGCCFGAKRIVDHFRGNGLPLKGVIALGGVAQKSDFVVQTMADVLELPIKVHASQQTSAVGAAMFAAVVAGIHPRVEVAMQRMGQGHGREFFPDPKRVATYRKRYALYRQLGTFQEGLLESRSR